MSESTFSSVRVSCRGVTDAIEELVAFLATCAEDQWAYLAGVGWLTRRRYKVYAGRVPRTGVLVDAGDGYLPFFLPDPELSLALDGLSSSNESFPDERARLHRARGSDDDERESFEIRRFDRADAIAEQIRHALVERGIVDVEGLGRFEVVTKPSRRFVRFQGTEDFKRRVGKPSGSSEGRRR
jgi:nucleoid DNA-binding protein